MWIRTDSVAGLPSAQVQGDYIMRTIIVAVAVLFVSGCGSADTSDSDVNEVAPVPVASKTAPVMDHRVGPGAFVPLPDQDAGTTD